MKRLRNLKTVWLAAFALFTIAVPGFLSPDASAESPPAKKILHVARLFDPQTLDPALVQLAEDFELLPLLYAPLLDNTNSTDLIPLSAKDWSMSKDARTYTVHLRPEIRFSNGREVVAEDYRYSLERVLNPATAAMMSGYLTHIEGAQEFMDGKTNHVRGIELPDRETLIIKLDRTDPTFGYLLVAIAYPVPREEVEKRGASFATNPVGNGPYRVKEWVRGVRLELERNPYYRGPAPCYLDGVDLMIGGDEFTHLLMFERGELDIADIRASIPFPDMPRIKRDPRWHGLLETAPLLETYGLILNCEVPPFDNVLVRRAANYAIDRDRRMRVGAGMMTHTEGVLPPLVRGYDPSFRGYEYNPEKARALLKQSGLPLPIHSVLWHSTEEWVRILAQGAQADLKQVGIEVELKTVTFSELVTAAQTRGKVPMSTIGWTVSIPDPVDMLGTQFDGRTLTNSATMNMAFYSNPKVNKLLDQGAVAIDLKRRFEIYRQAERLIVDDAPWVFLAHENVNSLRQPWLKGALIEPLYPFRLDRVWIDR